jgi:hypothetical protein
MSFWLVARGSFENTNCATLKNGVVTEMLTKRIFAPENATLTIFGGWPARPKRGFKIGQLCITDI